MSIRCSAISFGIRQQILFKRQVFGIGGAAFAGAGNSGRTVIFLDSTRGEDLR